MCEICRQRRQAALEQANIDRTTADAVLRLTESIQMMEKLGLTKQSEATQRLLDIILPPVVEDVKVNQAPEPQPVDPQVEAQRELLSKATGIPVDQIRHLGDGLYAFGL